MPRKRTRPSGKAYIANESFVTKVNGVDKAFHAGRSRAYEGDEVLERLPDYFDELEDHDAQEQQ